MSSAGDVDSGKAWRTVRRPSDMVSVFFILVGVPRYIYIRFDNETDCDLM